MVDDEKAVVYCSCVTDIMYYYHLLFQLTYEMNSFIETNDGDHNFIHIYRPTNNKTKLRIAPVALVVTDVSRLLYNTRDTARTSFSYTKMNGIDSES